MAIPDASPLASVSHTRADYIDFPVTSFIRNRLHGDKLARSEQAGDGILSLEIGNTSGRWLEYGSKERGNKPQLVIR